MVCAGEVRESPAFPVFHPDHHGPEPDLNMLNGDGLSVLAFIQHNPAWSVVPRIIFISSTQRG